MAGVAGRPAETIESALVKPSPLRRLLCFLVSSASVRAILIPSRYPCRKNAERCPAGLLKSLWCWPARAGVLRFQGRRRGENAGLGVALLNSRENLRHAFE